MSAKTGKLRMNRERFLILKQGLEDDGNPFKVPGAAKRKK